VCPTFRHAVRRKARYNPICPAVLANLGIFTTGFGGKDSKVARAPTTEERAALRELTALHELAALRELTAPRGNPHHQNHLPW
jgi:hypothetical protein